MSTRLSAEILQPELDFKASRSSGPGGQNVNKVNSRITLRFDIARSQILTDDEKAVLLNKLKSRLTDDGVLVLTVQESRSQLQNREDAISRLNTLLVNAFKTRKARKATKPSKRSVQKRLTGKKHQAEKKQWRQKPH